MRHWRLPVWICPARAFDWREGQDVRTLEGMTLRARIASLSILLVVASGCVEATSPAGAVSPERAASSPAERASRDGELPALLEELGLSAEQRRQLVALRGQLEQQLEPMEDAGRELVVAVATTVRRCEGTSPALTGAISWAVGSGEQVRGPVLDAVDRLHAILTRAQRETLVARLRGGEERSKDPSKTDEQTRSLGTSLDLSLSQLMTMLVRARALRDAVEERIEPWRGEARAMLNAFAQDDFAIRDHAIAQAPVFVLATELLRDGLRTLVPILKPEQCRALAAEIDHALAEYDERRAKEAKAINDDRQALP